MEKGPVRLNRLLAAGITKRRLKPAGYVLGRSRSGYVARDRFPWSGLDTFTKKSFCPMPVSSDAIYSIGLCEDGTDTFPVTLAHFCVAFKTTLLTGIVYNVQYSFDLQPEHSV